MADVLTHYSLVSILETTGQSKTTVCKLHDRLQHRAASSVVKLDSSPQITGLPPLDVFSRFQDLVDDLWGLQTPLLRSLPPLAPVYTDKRPVSRVEVEEAKNILNLLP